MEPLTTNQPNHGAQARQANLLVHLLAAEALRLESLRFELTLRARLLFDAVNFITTASGRAEAVVDPFFRELAAACHVPANHAGETIRRFLVLNGVLRVAPAATGALVVGIEFNFGRWTVSQRCTSEVHWKRINRLRAGAGLPPWLLPPEPDLKGAMAESCRESFIGRVVASLSLAGSDGSLFLSPGAGALVPVSGGKAVRFPDSGAGFPDSGKASGFISHAPARAVDVGQGQSKDQQSISTGPDSGTGTEWQGDGYVMGKLEQFPALRSEMLSGRTAKGMTSRLSLEFGELYTLDAQLARQLLGDMVNLRPTRRDGRATNHAGWLNVTVSERLSHLYNCKESLSNQ